MTYAKPILTLLLSSLLATACVGGQDTDETRYPGVLKQEGQSDIDDAVACDIDTPCPDGLECLYVDAFDPDTALCLDVASACDLLDCGEGECLILESYPGQLMCSGPVDDDGDDDGDGHDDDDCSDDDSVSTEPGGTEPGVPGEEA